MFADPSDQKPLDESGLSAMLGKVLGERGQVIAVTDSILHSLRVIIFNAKILCWEELAFGAGYVSRGIEDWLGWPRDKVTPDFFFDLIHREDLPDTSALTLTDLPQTLNGNFRISKSDGQWIWMLAVCSIRSNWIDGIMLAMPPERSA